MATDQVKLPAGFVLDNQSGNASVPEGFVLDEPQQETAPAKEMNPQEKAGDMASHFVQGIYQNPLVHSLAKNIPGAEEKSQGLGEPTGVMEKVAYGAGSAVPLIAATMPIGRIVEGALGAGEALTSVKLLSKLSGALKSSDLAKAAITGYGYGMAEAGAMNASGEKVEAHKYATDTAGQFLLWGALAKGGAKLGAKYLPKDLPQAEAVGAMLPGVLKKAYTAEGLGRISGGVLAGAFNAPDQESGVAGAFIGGAMSAFNPVEKYQFNEGLGKVLGENGIRSVTDKFGKVVAQANDVIVRESWGKVKETGEYIDPSSGENALHGVAKVQIGAYQERKQELKSQANVITAEMDQKGLHAKEDVGFLQSIERYIKTKFKTSGFDNQVKKVFNESLPFMQSVDVPGEIAVKYGLAPEGFKGKVWKAPINDLQMITNPETVQGLTAKYQQASTTDIQELLRKYGGKAETYQGVVKYPVNEVSFRALDDLKQRMSQIADKKDPYESGVASEITQQISNYMRTKYKPYEKLQNDWHDLFNIRDKIGEVNDYQKLALNLAQTHWAGDSTQVIMHENRYKAIDSYFNKLGGKFSTYTTKSIIDRFHAYEVYRNPSTFGLSKTFGQRATLSFLVGGVGSMAGLGPLGHLAGMLAAWKMSSLDAWMPVWEAASNAKMSKKR